jgi:hypothetical protein
LIAFTGFAIAALLSERALKLLKPQEKAALLDAFAQTRLFALFAAGLFIALMLWHQVIAWIFIGCAYVVLPGCAALRLQRLYLPANAAGRLLAAQFAAALGVVVCALIFVTRTLG